MKCDYGCNNEARYILPNGKNCCNKFTQRCPAIKHKNSIGVAKAHKEGKMKYDHLKGKTGWSKGKTAFTDKRVKSNYTYNDIFSKESIYPKNRLKEIVIQQNVIEYKCLKCANKGSWLNSTLILELHHDNGIDNDNRPENLQFLCPNCHSQTENFRGRGKVTGKKVSDLDLLASLNKFPNIRQALLNVGLVAKGANYNRCYKLLVKNI